MDNQLLLKIGSAELDSSKKIVSCNTFFSSIFDLKSQPINKHFSDLFSILHLDFINKVLKKLTDNKFINFTMLKNHNANINGLIIFYGVIFQTDHGYKINIINYLSWIHICHHSLLSAYDSFASINQKVDKAIIRKSHELYIIKTLLPLLTFSPDYGSIGGNQLGEIAHLFTARRKLSAASYKSDLTKALNRIKDKHQLTNFTIDKILTNHNIMTIHDLSAGVYIPEVEISENVYLEMTTLHDNLLNLFLGCRNECL